MAGGAVARRMHLPAVTGQIVVGDYQTGGGAVSTVSTVPGYYQQPAWSPDGARIVAMRSATRNLQEAIDPFIGNGIDAEFVWLPATGGAPLP